MTNAIGVDLGASKVRIALVNKKGNILGKRSEETDKSNGPDGVSAQIIRMIESIREKNKEEIEGIGIGSCGPLDVKNGEMVKPTNIPFDKIPLTDPIEKEFELPVFLVNDCNAAVVGEKFFGDGKGKKNLVYVTIGTGIGGGVIIDDKLVFGKDGNAAEVGHIVIDANSDMTCSRGQKGSWEAFCSGKNIPNYVRSLIIDDERRDGSALMKLAGGDVNQITAVTLCRAAQEGDELAIEIFDKIGKMNAVGIANIINAYDPELITIGGSVALCNPERIVEPIKKYVVDYAVNRIPEIKITKLGKDIGLFGAAALVFYHRKIFPKILIKL